ncbi:MAG: hypothetical protein ACRDLA_00125 [Thermoleophilaceae bacterium]
MAHGTAGAGAVETLIEVLLGEGEGEEAWQVAAERGCRRQLWLALARAREDECIGVYKREIEDLIDHKQTHWYEHAVGHVLHVGDLYACAGATDEYAAYLDELRYRHKPKTKFLAMLAAGPPSG